MTSRDISNLRKHFDADEELAELLAQVIQEDGNVENVDNENLIEFVYIQTSEIKNFKHYPELFMIDTTYKINRKNMHVGSLMVWCGILFPNSNLAVYSPLFSP